MLSNFDPAPVVTALRTLLPPTRPIPLHEPLFAGQEWTLVKDCLDTGWVSSVGAYVDRFERELAQRCGVSRAVCVINGTAGLHMALVLAGVELDDEVLLPSLTFVATANAVFHAGAVPHFVDCSPATLGLDAAALERYLDSVAERRAQGRMTINRTTGRRIRAVVPVHVFGHPVDMPPLLAVAERWGLMVVEDATEALGSRHHGRPAGSLSRMAVLSFNGNKIITTGGGGAILTDDPALAEAARHLTTTAKCPHPWRFDHDQVGWNYRMPNLNAALGCAQLARLDEFVAAKRSLAARYQAALSDLPGVSVVREPPGCESNYWLNAVLVPDAAARDALLAATHAEGILTRPTWTPLHLLPMSAQCPRADLVVTESLWNRIVCLPSGPGLGLG